MIQKLLFSTRRRALFLRFAGVGATISVIDAGGLYALHEGFGLNVYAARLVSFLAAMTAGYLLNTRFTFYQHVRFRHLGHELARYYSVHATGGLLNYAVFMLVLALGHRLELASGATFWLPLLGVWLGGVVGMCFNFVLSHKLVFQGS